MKSFFQFMVILLFSFIGELLHELLPFPIPASVYGLVLLFACLLAGVVKLSQIEDAADFLLKIMPALFIPSVVKLMTISDLLWANLLPIVVIVLASTVVVMAVTGRIAQGMIKRKESREKNE